MLKDKVQRPVQIAQESIKTTLEFPLPLNENPGSAPGGHPDS